MTMPGAVQKDRGQPALIRIGVIETVSPVSVRIQETLIPADRVGALRSYMPVAGDTVAVAGQSAVGSSASSWLILGSVGTPGSTDLSTISLSLQNQSIPDATLEEIEFTGVNYNTGEYVWDGFADITLPFDGIYHYTLNVTFDPPSGTGVRYCEILIGGSQKARHRHPAIAGDFADLGSVYEGQADAGTIVNFRVYQTSGAPLNLFLAEATIRFIGAA